MSGRGLEGFHPDSREGGHAGVGGERCGRPCAVLVFVPVAIGDTALDESVFEVDPQVLDRLAPQFRSDQGQDRVGDLRLDAGDGSEIGRATDMGIEGAECFRSPPRDHLGVVPVCGHVHGVHRLSGAGIAGVGRGVRGVDVHELIVERSGERIQFGQADHSCPASTAVYGVMHRRYRGQVMRSVN